MTMTKSNKIEQDFERFLIFLILFLFYINSFLIFRQNYSHKKLEDSFRFL